MTHRRVARGGAGGGREGAIIMESGVRRGTDAFKALARGATAVAIGRPYLWGLGAFGEEGAARALEILDREFELTLRAAGTPKISDIGARSVASMRG